MSSLDSAIQLAKTGAYQQAIQTIQNLPEADQPSEINYYLGLWHLKSRETKKGITHFQKEADAEGLIAKKACQNLD